MPIWVFRQEVKFYTVPSVQINFYDGLCSKETTRCEYLTTIQLAGSKPFIQLEPLFTKAAINLTMVIKTKEKSGVLLYYGQSDHLAVELFHGRVRVRDMILKIYYKYVTFSAYR